MQRGAWTTLAGWQPVWRVSLRSLNAWGMRLHFSDFHAGDGRVWLYPKGGDTDKGQFVGPYRGDGMFHDGEFWSGAVPGEEVVLEFAPADPVQDLNAPPLFVVDQISDLFNEPLAPMKAATLGPMVDGPADAVNAQLSASQTYLKF